MSSAFVQFNKKYGHDGDDDDDDATGLRMFNIFNRAQAHSRTTTKRVRANAKHFPRAQEVISMLNYFVGRMDRSGADSGNFYVSRMNKR